MLLSIIITMTFSGFLMLIGFVIWYTILKCVLPHALVFFLHKTSDTPDADAPESGAVKSTPDSGVVFRADAPLLTSWSGVRGPWFGARRQSATLEVVHRHERLTTESGVDLMALTRLSGACVRGVKFDRC